MNTINELSEVVIGLCIKINRTIGIGLCESVYEAVLCYELSKNDISFVCQHPIPVYYENIKMDVGFRADLIIENKLLVEIKSIETIAPVHKRFNHTKFTEFILCYLLSSVRYFVQIKQR